MAVTVQNGEGGYINLSGCGKGRSSGHFSSVKAGATCKVIINGVSTTFKAKSRVTCLFVEGGSRLKCN